MQDLIKKKQNTEGNPILCNYRYYMIVYHLRYTYLRDFHSLCNTIVQLFMCCSVNAAYLFKLFSRVRLEIIRQC